MSALVTYIPSTPVNAAYPLVSLCFYYTPGAMRAEPKP